MTIPIRNVYFLLCYALRHVQQLDRARTGVDRFAAPADLFGFVLAGVTARLLARGLERKYTEVTDEIPGIRGRFDVLRSSSPRLAASRKTMCEFDELLHDTLENRIIKAALCALLRVSNLDSEVRSRVRRVVISLPPIADIHVRATDFSRLTLHRNNRGYDFALRVSRLVLERVIVNEDNGTAEFRDFRRDEAAMNRIFEEFLFNFYRHEQTQYRVARPILEWREARGSSHALGYLPRMRTDVVLTSGDRTIIMDAKYYAKPLEGHWGTRKVQSGHLYQITAYLRNFPTVSDTPVMEGLLLYPTVDEPFMLDYHLDGYRVRAASIDLDQEWWQIRSDLLDLVRIQTAVPV
jgi:5-methylcytosine-specific restriction enzyme subunit McrC